MAKTLQAVIETGGKQYLVGVNDKIVLEKLEALEASNVNFDKVLAVIDGDSVKVGKPYVLGAKVVATVESQRRGPKLTIFKYRAKSRYRRKTGHRQGQTVVRIESIS